MVPCGKVKHISKYVQLINNSINFGVNMNQCFCYSQFFHSVSITSLFFLELPLVVSTDDHQPQPKSTLPSSIVTTTLLHGFLDNAH